MTLNIAVDALLRQLCHSRVAVIVVIVVTCMTRVVTAACLMLAGSQVLCMLSIVKLYLVATIVKHAQKNS